MGTPITYGVNVHQINSGKGDSAIHLQLQLSGQIPNTVTNVTASKPYVLKAVLIDGGMNEREAPSNLWYAIQEMPDKYMFSTTPSLNKCKFDAVIITHWDTDHHSGLFQRVIPYDLESMQATTLRPNRQVSFFKYGTTTDRSAPETVIYAPNWDRLDEVSLKKTNAGTAVHTISGASSTLVLGKTPTVTNGSKYYVAYRVGKNSKAASDELKLAYQYDNVCLYETGPILGAEFFSGTLLASSVPPTITGVNGANGLLSKHPNLGQKPGLFCLASMRKVIGPGSGSSSTTAHNNLLFRPTNVKQGLVGTGPVHVVADLIAVGSGEGTATNRSSIATAIIFADGHISW